MAEQILLVDDEPAILSTLSGILTDEGYDVHVAGNGVDALRLVQSASPEVVLLDIWMPDPDGLVTLKKIKASSPEVIIVMMSGHGSIETAVKAIKLGAYDYIEKPLSLEKVVLMVKHALTERRLQQENKTLKMMVKKRYEMIGASPPILDLIQQIKMAGPSQSRVLISGENGTGKELVARMIHAQSQRREGPFLEINCAAIPIDLIESELFGYEKGAFTGAQQRKKGQFELAHGGTLFLDEIGDMSLSTQSKVLRVLQDQVFYRVGGGERIKVNVRVIAASNKILSEEIKKETFREDLYYRLNVIPLHVPPLRERVEDIPRLIEHFMKEISQEQGLKPKKIDTESYTLMKRYGWPGNVRELRNITERLMIMVPSQVITRGDLPDFIQYGKAVGDRSQAYQSISTDTSSLKEARSLFEKKHIMEKLEKNDWNVIKTAEALQIERTYLYRKMKFLGIETPEEK